MRTDRPKEMPIRPKAERPTVLSFRGKAFSKTEILSMANEARAAFSKAVVIQAVDTQVFTIVELQRHVRTISEDLLKIWREDAEVKAVLKGPATLCLKDPAVDKMFRPTKRS